MLPVLTDLTLMDPAPAGGPSLLQSLAPFAIILGIFYVLLILPQQREKKAHESLLASLQRDDRVVTQAGVHGRIVEVRDSTVLVDVGGKVTIEFDKSTVARREDAATA